jgi:hypothetical protein
MMPGLAHGVWNNGHIRAHVPPERSARARRLGQKMPLPTEPIGSIPRPLKLLEAISAAADGTDPALESLYDQATRDTIEQFEAPLSRPTCWA